MIKELSRDFIALIKRDYPELEELNLSNNGKLFIIKVHSFSRQIINLLFFILALEIEVV